MATKQITARVDEELLQDVASRIEAIKRESRGGVEINLATVIRYSLEKYLEEQEEIDKDIQVIKFDLNKISEDKLRKLEKISGELSDLFSCGWEEEIPLVKSTFMLHEAVKYKLFELSKKEE